jgi:hypothetical protein
MIVVLAVDARAGIEPMTIAAPMVKNIDTDSDIRCASLLLLRKILEQD